MFKVKKEILYHSSKNTFCCIEECSLLYSIRGQSTFPLAFSILFQPYSGTENMAADRTRRILSFPKMEYAPECILYGVAISQIVNVCLETVSRLFDVWELATAENKLSTPGIASGRGAKVLNLVGYKYDIKFY